MNETAATAENHRARTRDPVRRSRRLSDPTRAWIIAGAALLAAASGGYVLMSGRAKTPAAAAQPVL